MQSSRLPLTPVSPDVHAPAGSHREASVPDAPTVIQPITGGLSPAAPGEGEGVERISELPPSGQAPRTNPWGLPPVDVREPYKVIRDRWIAHLEREYVVGILSAHRGNVSASAAAAGLDRAYFYRLLRKHGL